MFAIGMCAIVMWAIGIVSGLLCSLSGYCALYALRYRDTSPFSLCAIGMCAIGIVSVLLCALSGCCAFYAVRYRDPSPFTLCAIGMCAIGMCAIGHYGQFTVCYRDVCYRDVRYRDVSSCTSCYLVTFAVVLVCF